MTYRTLWLTPAFAAVLVLPAAAQQRTITLAEAVAMAQRVQPATVQAEGAVKTADAQRLAVYGEYLPNVNANASGNHSYSEFQRPDPVTGQILQSGTSSTSLSAGISGSVDIFTGFRRGADMNAATAAQRAAAAGLVSARYTVVVTTTQAFITALTQQQLVAVDSDAVVRAASQLQVATEKLRVGAATRSDSLTALVALGTARLNLVNAKAALITAQAGLARLVGIPGQVAAQDDSTFHHVVETVDTAEIRREALAQAPAIRSADATADAAHANLRAARAGYWPTLSASANANWSGNNAQDYHLLPNRSIGLQLSWPLFNRFVRERTIAQNQVNADVADANAQDARRALDASLSQQLAQLDAARTTISISQTSVTSAQEALRVVQERYRAGTATIVDVQVAQDALNTAEVSVLQARFAYLTAKAQIEALIGRSL